MRLHKPTGIIIQHLAIDARKRWNLIPGLKTFTYYYACRPRVITVKYQPYCANLFESGMAPMLDSNE